MQQLPREQVHGSEKSHFLQQPVTGDRVNAHRFSIRDDRDARDSSSVQHETAEPPEYPSGIKLMLLAVGVLCTVFLVSLE